MKARMLLAGGNFDTAKLRAVWAAFDMAWGQIAPAVGSNPESIEAARINLANMILEATKGLETLQLTSAIVGTPHAAQ